MKKGYKMAVIICVGLVFIICLALGGFCIFMYGFESKTVVPNNEQKEHIGFYVDGTTLKNKDGSQFVMRGINHSHTWFKDYDDVALDTIKNTGSNCVRLVFSNGDKWEADSKETVANLIEASRERNLVSIVEIHDGTGSNDIESLRKITEYWISMADIFEGTEDYCILNIANEWGAKWSSKLWKKAYIEMLPKLREAGIKNTIMIDAMGWGQFGKSIRDYGTDVFMADPDRNTMFSIHMYGFSGGSKRAIKYGLEGARNHNLCIVVGEFGYKHTDGDVDEDFIMQYCTENNIGYLPWSLKGNSKEVEYLDLSYDWEGNRLTPEWGEKVINGKNGIRETSKISTCFTN